MADQTIPPPPPGYGPAAGAAIPPPPDGYAFQNAPQNAFTEWFTGGKRGPSQINDVSTMLPKLGTQAIASMPTDPRAKMQYLAQQIFPDMDPETALGRMGVDSGRAFYIGEDGKAYYAEPGDFSPISEPLRTAAQLPDMAAAEAGPAMSTIGGIGGGLGSAEFLGGVPGAMAGGAAGDAVRQFTANQLTGEQKPVTSRILQTAGAAASQGAGQILGLGLAKGAGAALNRNPLRVAGYDAGGLTSKRIDEMQKNADLANRLGVQVTPGEAGNISSLLARQRQILRQPEGANKVSQLYSTRNAEQLPAGWEKTLSTIAPSEAPGVGARNLADASQKVIGAAKAERSALAGPLYKEAFAANQSVDSPEIDLILKTPAGRKALTDAATIMQNDRAFMALPDPEKTALVNELVSIGKMKDPETGVGVATGLKMRSLDYVKQALDTEYKALSRAGRDGEARPIKDLARALRIEMDRLDITQTATPVRNAGRFTGEITTGPGKYAQARSAFAGESPNVTSLEKGLVGLVAKDRASGWQNTPKTMFDISSADPMSIASARTAFEKAGKMQEWNAGLRSYLQNAFGAATKTGGDAGPANNIWKNLKADPRQYANLKAATTPAQLRSLDDFFAVAEMVKRAPKEGSPTATDLNARTDFAGGGAKTVGSIARGTNPLNWSKMLGDWFEEKSAAKNINQLADIITSPDAIQSLRKLRVLKPGTQKFITEAGYLTQAIGMSQVGGNQPDQLPAMFRGQ